MAFFGSGNTGISVGGGTADSASTINFIEGTNVTITTSASNGVVDVTINAAGGGGGTDHGTLSGLGDDDHPQYHNDSRADTWLGTKDTDDLTEGAANFYFTNERVDDRVAALLVEGTGITLTYADGSDTLTIDTNDSEIDHGFLGGLSDDDHPQYHNDSRADTWLGTKDTDDLSEGITNLYFTNERAQDAVGGILTDTTSIDFTYNDGANTITADVLPGGVDHGSLGGLTDDDHTQYHNDSRALTWLGTRSTTDLPEGSNLYYTNARFDTQLATKDTDDLAEGATNLYFTDERVDDRVSGLLVAGTNITLTYDDGANTLTIDSSAGAADHGSLTGLGDDDHLQYHTDARALTWLGTRSTTDLPEGTNLYYTSTRFDTDFSGKDTDDLSEGTTNLYFTDERVDDRVASLLVGGTNVTITYDDGANTLTIDSPDTGVTDHGALTGLTDDDHTQYHTDARALTWLGTRSTTDLPEGTNLYYTNTRFDTQLATKDTDDLTEGATNLYYTNARFDTQLATKDTGDLAEGSNLYFTDERVDDRVNSLLVAGTNITLTYNDIANTLTIDSTGGGGATDHGALTGLGDDEHTQYLTEARHAALAADNPHSVTFTQAVTADGGTNITAAEAETLTDGSVADSLHEHRVLVDNTSTTHVEVLNDGDVQLAEYPQNTRDDGTDNDLKVLTTDNSGTLELRRVLPYFDHSTTTTGLINQTTTFEDYLTLSATIPETGTYKVEWWYEWSYNTGGVDFLGRIVVDGVVVATHIQEPQDTGGTGVTLDTTGGGTANSGTNQRYWASGQWIGSITSGARTLEIEFAGSTADDEAAIYRGNICVTRVS